MKKKSLKLIKTTIASLSDNLLISIQGGVIESKGKPCKENYTKALTCQTIADNCEGN